MKAAIVPEPTTYEQELSDEGSRSEIILSLPERDPKLRIECLNHYGYTCLACGFNFRQLYGSIGSRFIHVHHLTPLATGERAVDPLKDMRPLCPNCHAMAHRRNPPFSIKELKKFIQDNVASCGAQHQLA